MDFRRKWLGLVLTIGAIPVARGLANPDSNPPPPTTAPTTQPAAIVAGLRHDASLADVFFIDPKTGWTVGDRGVIWHTQDGGTTWCQQISNVSCQLNSVFFIDARRGWTAGGELEPQAAASGGVILRTDDGGNTWTCVSNPPTHFGQGLGEGRLRLLLPHLARIKFFDQNRGIAIGAASSAQPSGAFATADGGNTWQPIPTNRDGGWLTGDFADADSGTVAGASGRFAQLAKNQIIHPTLDLHSPRAFHALRLLPPTRGWLVGDGGLVLLTKDLGHTWQSPSGDPASAGGHFDFHAVAARDQQVWTAGSPGTRIFHSPDNGQTWQSFSTNQAAPIRAITFIDSTHGWAVGDLGNILATSDGGRTWTSQRSGGQRAALLGIFADASDVPLEVIAANSAADGYLTAIEILHTTTGEPASAGGRPTSQLSTTSDQNREPLLLAGASSVNTAWRFPLPPGDLAHTPPELLAALNRETDGRAIELIQQQLVRSIRMWRPEVIITRQPKLESCEPHQAILAALVMQSIAAAADHKQNVELANNAGLAPWKVKKVYGLLPSGSHGAESIVADQFSPLLGVTLSNFVAPARRRARFSGRDATTAPPPNQYDFDLLACTIAHTSTPLRGGPGRGFFSGIPLAWGSEARRPASDLPINDLDQLRRTAERRHQLEALLEHTQGNAAWVAQIGQITEGLTANDGAELLVQLADGYRTAGRLDLAADTYYLLARRYPDHPHAARSLEWLIQFYASSETSHRLASRGSHNVRQAAYSSIQHTPGEPASAGGPPADSTPTLTLSRDDRLQRASQLAEFLRSAKPELYAEPRVRFAEVAALRQLGLANPAKRYYLTLRQLPETNPWRRCGETEIWLATPAESPPPKTLGACRPTTERPKLDANLDEPFWDKTDRLRLRDNNQKSNDAPRAEVRLAHDHEHLYVAIRCPKVANASYNMSDQPRPRDADLSQQDRVTLRFDIDRDFTTAFELMVDSRGWTHDSCWGDMHWNPNWYVAAASDDATWTIEAALPLSELAETPPAARHVWAVSACRTIPAIGYQSWTGDPAPDSPNQYGFLIFE